MNYSSTAADAAEDAGPECRLSEDRRHCPKRGSLFDPAAEAVESLAAAATGGRGSGIPRPSRARHLLKASAGRESGPEHVCAQRAGGAAGSLPLLSVRSPATTVEESESFESSKSSDDEAAVMWTTIRVRVAPS